MATFTRIIQRRVGSVSTVDTYSVRGHFTPADAFRALEQIGEVKNTVVHELKVDIAPAFERLKRWEASVDPRTNCRCTIDPKTVGIGAPAYPMHNITTARRSLMAAVKYGAPIEVRRKLQRRIHYLLGKGPLSPKGNRTVHAIRKRNRKRSGER